MSDDDDFPPELDRMIDEFEGDTHEYAKGVVDAWRHLTGRPPQYSGERLRRNAELQEHKRRVQEQREARRAQLHAERPF